MWYKGKMVLSVASYNFLRWHKNARVVTAFLLDFILCYLLTDKAVQFALGRDTTMQIFEAFIWTFGDSNAILLVSLLLLILFADMPFITTATPFYLMRTTRRVWVVGQMVYVVLATLLFMVFTLFSTVVLTMQNAFTGNRWSRTAAALAYGLDNEAPQKILVYDLGGGTFDVSIIEIEDGTFTVLATGGDTRLGGDDFDQRIVEYAVAEFKKSDRIDLSRDPAAMGRLKEEAEKAKKELSSALSAQLNLPFIAVGKDGPHHLDLTISRPQFEMMTGDLLARTVAPVQNALRDAGISASQLGKVLLVGGSTRMPAVERQVKELLGCEPSHSLNPDECVAMGAAVQGGLLQGGGKLAGASGAAAQGLVLMDVTPLTLSIETLGGVATPLITRNSMIPTRKSQIFTTARPMQTSVEINVLQGERHFARDNKSLGKFKLNGIRASFSSKPQIEVTFDIDVNGVVKVSAKDLGTGREQNITITGSTNLSENEIQRAMADAAAYEAEDSRRKERLDLHNQAEVLAYKVDEALSKCKKELDKEEKNRIKADVANLRRCLRKDKPEKMNETEEANLRQAKSQLEASANHLMVLYASEQSENGSDNTL